MSRRGWEGPPGVDHSANINCQEAKVLGVAAAAAAGAELVLTYAVGRRRVAKEVPVEEGRWGVRHIKRELKIARHLREELAVAGGIAAAGFVAAEVAKSTMSKPDPEKA